MHAWIVIAVGIVLGIAGITEGQDGIVAWVFELVAQQHLTDIWRPVYNPEPMDTYAYRPLSVLILKSMSSTMASSPLVWPTIHALGLALYGWVAWLFLRVHGFNPMVSCVAAIAAMAMPSILFSAWICVEFDVLGAAAVMGTAIVLVRAVESSNRWHWGLFTLLALVSMTVKETSALQLLAYLVAFATLYRNERKSWLIVGMYVVALLVLTGPIHFVEGGNRSPYHWGGEEFDWTRILSMLFHVGSQLVFLLSAAGIGLLLLAALRRRGFSSRVRALAGAAWLALLVGVAPILRYYSHFESVVFSDWWWTLILVGLWFMSWGILMRRGASRDGSRALAGMVLLTVLGFSLAPLVLSFARADVSARIFAACVPVLFAFAGRELAALWNEKCRWLRSFGIALGALFLLFVGTSAFNAISVHRARMSVPHPVKNTMAESIETTCPSIVTVNPVQLVTAAGLRARGATELDPDVGVEQLYLRHNQWESREALLRELGVEPGQEVLVYVEGPRAAMSAAARTVLRGDFGWTYDWIPDGEDGLFDDYQDMVYGDTIPIETAFGGPENARTGATVPYVQLPTLWSEIPRRLVQGIPLIESYEYVARLYYRPMDATAIKDAPCRRRDSGKHRDRAVP